MGDKLCAPTRRCRRAEPLLKSPERCHPERSRFSGGAKFLVAPALRVQRFRYRSGRRVCVRDLRVEIRSRLPTPCTIASNHPGGHMLRVALLLIVIILAAVLVPKLIPSSSLPKEGSSAPDFSLPSQDGSVVSLHDLRGKWVVLYFYPKDQTPG